MDSHLQGVKLSDGLKVEITNPDGVVVSSIIYLVSEYIVLLNI